MNFLFPLEAKPLPLSDDGKVLITPSVVSNSNDYEFLLGDHTVLHKKLKYRFQNSTEWNEFRGCKSTKPIVGDLGNIEEHDL
jgi:hypothetical protein